jgi:ATP-dependent protease Clp ATPase subunit
VAPVEGTEERLADGWGLYPEDIVQHLDRFVIGQEEAKK